jgi:hypothetical protein
MVTAVADINEDATRSNNTLRRRDEKQIEKQITGRVGALNDPNVDK